MQILYPKLWTLCEQHLRALPESSKLDSAQSRLAKHVAQYILNRFNGDKREALDAAKATVGKALMLARDLKEVNWTGPSDSLRTLAFAAVLQAIVMESQTQSASVKTKDTSPERIRSRRTKKIGGIREELHQRRKELRRQKRILDALLLKVKSWIGELTNLRDDEGCTAVWMGYFEPPFEGESGNTLSNGFRGEDFLSESIFNLRRLERSVKTDLILTRSLIDEVANEANRGGGWLGSTKETFRFIIDRYLQQGASLNEPAVKIAEVLFAAHIVPTEPRNDRDALRDQISRLYRSHGRIGITLRVEP